MSNRVLYAATKIAVKLFGMKDTSSWPPLLLQHLPRVTASRGSSFPIHPGGFTEAPCLGPLFHFLPSALFLLARCPCTILPSDFSDTSFGFLRFFRPLIGAADPLRAAESNYFSSGLNGALNGAS